MRIIRELDQAERDYLKEKHKDTPAPQGHISRVLDRPHCYKAHIDAEDLGKILIFSFLPQGSYNPISEVIEFITTNHNLETEGNLAGLSGESLRWQVGQLRSCQGKLQDCLVALGDYFLFDGDSPPYLPNQVTDGRHRLVAYGLVSEMRQEHFPIAVYYGTDRNLLSKDDR